MKIAETAGDKQRPSGNSPIIMENIESILDELNGNCFSFSLLSIHSLPLSQEKLVSNELLVMFAFANGIMRKPSSCLLLIWNRFPYIWLSFTLISEYDQQKTSEIPKLLEEYITHLAKTGDTLFPWSKVRGVLRHKLEIVIAAFREVCPIENVPPCPNVEPFNYETMKDKILEQFDSFT